MENIWPRRVGVTQEQATKLNSLIQEFAPLFTKYSEENGMLFNTKEPYSYASGIHWFEFCFTVLAPNVAIHYTKHHMDSTQGWARRMILQKLAHEVFINNPIDTLYSIWTDPQLYKQGL